MADYIPEEILVQVLKHLPVKSLVQSRCVCKWWKQLIDSPSLVLDHLALQKPRLFIANIDYYRKPTFLLLDDPQTLPLVDTVPYSSEKWPRVDLALMGTLHGIVCLYDYCMISGIYLWNPSMRKLLNVPIPGYMHDHRNVDGPENPPHNYTCPAFWIDPLTKHFEMVVYKVVHDYYGDVFEKYGAIYSSIEGDWKEISPGQLKSITDYWFYPLSNDPGLVMKKVAYWRAYYYIPPKGLEWDDDEFRDVVISFDFEQERFDSIEGPSVTFSCCYSSLCKWHGSLSLLYLDWKNSCDFYSRQEGSWVNLFSISLTPNIRRVYCILKETEENSKILLAETTDDELVLFDTTRFSCVTLKSGENKPKFHGQMAHDFVESLVFP